MAGDIQKFCFQVCIKISGSRPTFYLFFMISRFSGMFRCFAATSVAEYWKPVKSDEAQTWNCLIC